MEGGVVSLLRYDPWCPLTCTVQEMRSEKLTFVVVVLLPYTPSTGEVPLSRRASVNTYDTSVDRLQGGGGY